MSDNERLYAVKPYFFCHEWDYPIITGLESTALFIYRSEKNLLIVPTCSFFNFKCRCMYVVGAFVSTIGAASLTCKIHNYLMGYLNLI